MTNITDALSHAVNYAYDGLNRLTNRTDQLGKVEIYRYDKNGNVTNFVDRRGVSIGFKYDILDRQTGVVYAANNTVRYFYDKVGRVTNVTDSIGGTIRLTYDSLDRLTREIGPNGTNNYGYNDGGLRTNLTVTGETTVKYLYDAGSRLTNVIQGTFTNSLFYDDGGRRTKMILPNGINVLYLYDTASRLTNLTYLAAVTNRIDYAYDELGNRIAQASLLANYLLPAAVTNSSYNAANQQLTFGSYNLLYDAAGNVTNIVSGTTTNRLVWSPRNQLTNMTGAVSAFFLYDGLGRRITRTVSSSTERYHYDGLDVMLQRTSTGAIGARYFRGLGIDEPWLRSDIGAATTNRTYLVDALGSIVALTDSSKVISNRYAYEPFGVTTNLLGSNKNTFKFTAREDDGAGLYYYRARYYHPVLGRFVSEDPIEYAGEDINLYAYVFNDPVNGFDPYGLKAWYDRWIDNSASLAAGAGDNLSMGLTRIIRNQFEFYNGTVDPCSGWYSSGEWFGTSLSLATGVAGGLKAAGTKGIGKEFSHWLPNRLGGSRSLWNGNFVTTAEHALSDPYRYRFMKRAWKGLNPLPNVAKQQWNRIPNAIKGTGLGAGYGATSQSVNACGCQ